MLLHVIVLIYNQLKLVTFISCKFHVHPNWLDEDEGSMGILMAGDLLTIVTLESEKYRVWYSFLHVNKPEKNIKHA